MYVTYTLFKGCTLEALHEAIEYRIQQFHGEVYWNTDKPKGIYLGIETIHDVHTIAFGYRGGIYGLFKGIGKRLRCPWMEARIQEGNHWDYSLMNGEMDIDCFSTFPQFYDRSAAHRKKFQGNPAALASAWEITPSCIERYLVNWGDAGQVVTREPFPFMKTMVVDAVTAAVNTVSGRIEQRFKREGKAYPTDEHEYGDCWQLIDFIHAIGGDVSNPGGRHQLSFPDNTNLYRDGIPD